MTIKRLKIAPPYLQFFISDPGSEDAPRQDNGRNQQTGRAGDDHIMPIETKLITPSNLMIFFSDP